MKLSELREIGERATPGVWEDDARFLTMLGGKDLIYGVAFAVAEDAKFVAAARNHWDLMCDVIEAVKACFDDSSSNWVSKQAAVRDALHKLEKLP